MRAEHDCLDRLIFNHKEHFEYIEKHEKRITELLGDKEKLIQE